MEDLRENWSAISAHLTASYSKRRKATLHKQLSTVVAAIELRIASEATTEEELANRWRHVEALLSSIVAELAMWIAISDERIADAWNCFCAAESDALWAARHFTGEPLLQARLAHLADVERIGFPRQERFASPGMVIDNERCSICDATYGTCSHLAGEVYAGTIARRKVGRIVAVDHVSYVENPDNKACRVVDVGGIDPLSGEPPRRQKPTPPVSDALRVKKKRSARRRKR